jgi:glycosyltransferase involved in cell wall biosynthesis
MDWLDAGLVEATARAWPECTIVLIGPAYAADWWERQRALQALPNVHYLGKVDYREFPAYVQCLDLALMPLERSALKRVSHPNKLYEYTAAGVPVLAIDYCSTVAAARRVITVASTPGEFTRLVPEALADTAREARQAFARAHSWDTLAGIMIRELLACLQGGCR